jgi:hypothetical protein
VACLNWNFAYQRRLNRLWIGFCVPGLLACLHAVIWRDELLQRRDQAIAELTDASQRIVQREHSIAPPPSSLEAVFREMRSPWVSMFESLQQTKHPGVVLIALGPDRNQLHRVHISGIAERAQDALNLVETLQANRSWSAVQLVNQSMAGNISTTASASPDIPTLPGLSPRGVSFSLVAEWVQP